MKKSLLWVLIMLLTVSMIAYFSLAGCKKEEAAVAEEEEAVGEEAVVEEEVVVEEAEPITIEWWHLWKNEPIIGEPMAQLADEYMAANPHVTIDIVTVENEAYKDKIAIAMQAADPPDIFQSWGGGTMGLYADAGLILDITEYLADGTEWGDSLAGGAKGAFTWNGKNYAAPWRISVAGWWYWKDLFDQAGITAPPATVPELLDAIEALQAADIVPIAMGAGEKWPAMFFVGGALTQAASVDEIYAADLRTGGAFNSSGWVAAFQAAADIAALDPFQEGWLAAGYGDAASDFANQDVAMMLMGQWNYGFAKTLFLEGGDIDEAYYDANLGFFPAPEVPGGNGSPTTLFAGGDSFAIGINAPEGTVDFVKYLTSAYAQQLLADTQAVTIPVVVSGVTVEYTSDCWAEQIVPWVNQGSATVNWLDQQLSPPINNLVNDVSVAVLEGLMTPQEAADALEASAVENLDI